jgi:hypothetical protein
MNKELSWQVGDSKYLLKSNRLTTGGVHSNSRGQEGKPLAVIPEFDERVMSEDGRNQEQL